MNKNYFLNIKTKLKIFQVLNIFRFKMFDIKNSSEN